ncbi:hypothetical protein [Acidovorax sp. JG5]|uniref:hypothetical protein n=1 Tax=Acidovorax sp. JG5 TaxID=2822718 RepID=UPI000B3FD73F|nr:hypothetical protein [Acidovorax sp. JG5]
MPHDAVAPMVALLTVQGVDGTTLRALLQRALARSPAARYATAEAFRDALRGWAAPVSAPTAASNASRALRRPVC